MIKPDHLIAVLSSIMIDQFMSCKHRDILFKYIIPAEFFSLYAKNNAASFSPKLKHLLLRNNEHISYVLTKAQSSVVTQVESLLTDCNYSHILMQAPTKVAESTWISLFYWETRQERLLHMKTFTRWHSSFAYINRKLGE